jgi:hypothetical protein
MGGGAAARVAAPSRPRMIIRNLFAQFDAAFLVFVMEASLTANRAVKRITLEKMNEKIYCFLFVWLYGAVFISARAKHL